MAVFSSLVQALALASAIVASPIGNLDKRAVIGHNKVAGFAQTPESVPSGCMGDLYLAYQPFLKVESGCVPFPAVDADGNTGGGLAPSGSPSGKCGSNPGQVYVRSAEYGGNTVLMYSWYFPKDSPSDGFGHRHDWEGVIVYVKSINSTTPENVLAVCPSAHGAWYCATTGFTLSGTSPLIIYDSEWPVNHALALTGAEGGKQPLIAWEKLPPAASSALATADFGAAIVPFKDDTFWKNVHAANW
ncbi:hypothetical protein LZ554_003219 [Drepanopeziza brunnea f. sp. 'monogermtubi']|nr:hypothetical protein LZ554_003219 [Drepanopeziza brunnea f. sp. 'monogermtubi']WAX25718.1 NLP3 [Drepanopeziza brunnea f. sp. 'monogermtubi']